MTEPFLRLEPLLAGFVLVHPFDQEEAENKTDHCAHQRGDADLVIDVGVDVQRFRGYGDAAFVASVTDAGELGDHRGEEVTESQGQKP